MRGNREGRREGKRERKGGRGLEGVEKRKEENSRAGGSK